MNIYSANLSAYRATVKKIISTSKGLNEGTNDALDKWYAWRAVCFWSTIWPRVLVTFKTLKLQQRRIIMKGHRRMRTRTISSKCSGGGGEKLSRPIISYFPCASYRKYTRVECVRSSREKPTNLHISLFNSPSRS